jgi:hypothetical protein
MCRCPRHMFRHFLRPSTRRVARDIRQDSKPRHSGSGTSRGQVVSFRVDFLENEELLKYRLDSFAVKESCIAQSTHTASPIAMYSSRAVRP